MAPTGGDIRTNPSLPRGGVQMTPQKAEVEEWAPDLPVWTLGADGVDECLPNGALTISALHEISPMRPLDAPAAMGFIVALLVRLQRGLRRSGRKHILWCSRGFETREFGALYGPGLQQLGLDPSLLRIVRVERDDDVLWAMEEGLGCSGLAGVVGEVADASLTATRRLLLAAGKSGVPGILLRSSGPMAPSAAYSRWRVGMAPSLSPHSDDLRAETDNRAFFPSWQVELARQRFGSQRLDGLGGQQMKWNMVWNYEKNCFHMAETLAAQQCAVA